MSKGNSNFLHTLNFPPKTPDAEVGVLRMLFEENVVKHHKPAFIKARPKKMVVATNPLVGVVTINVYILPPVAAAFGKLAGRGHVSCNPRGKAEAAEVFSRINGSPKANASPVVGVALVVACVHKVHLSLAVCAAGKGQYCRDKSLLGTDAKNPIGPEVLDERIVKECIAECSFFFIQVVPGIAAIDADELFCQAAGNQVSG